MANLCSPFGRIALLLLLGEYAFRLVVRAMAALGHLAVALDFLLSAHIACLLALSDRGSFHMY